MAGRGRPLTSWRPGRFLELSEPQFLRPCANSLLGLDSCPLPSSGAPPPGSPCLTNGRVSVSLPQPHGEGAMGTEPLISNSANQNWSPISSGDQEKPPVSPEGKWPCPKCFFLSLPL